MSCMPNTMKDFYEWVKARDPAEEYNYYCSQGCARARYCQDRGLRYNEDTMLDGHPIEAAARQDGDFRDDDRSASKLTMGGLRKEIEEHWL